MIMGPEKDTLTISLLKAIDEANRTINALVEASKIKGFGTSLNKKIGKNYLIWWLLPWLLA